MKWDNVRIPTPLAKEIERAVQAHPQYWVSKSNFVRDAVREKIEALRKEPKP